MSKINLLDHQKKAIQQLRTGSILWGGVGSGKSLTALVYFYNIECNGYIGEDPQLQMKNPKDLYIITVARKRDSLDWQEECSKLSLSTDRNSSLNGVQVTVDSWNNIAKYKKVKDAFFIFDEQKVGGSGKWSRAFVKITKSNNWILLTATPGDTWMDYVSVFVANGFYRTRSEFVEEHVVYNAFTRYPKVDKYLNPEKLYRLRDQVLIRMEYESKSVRHECDVIVPYDKELFNTIYEDKWNPFENRPIKNSGDYCYALRRAVNIHPMRYHNTVRLLLEKHKRLIVFYNFDYELDHLRCLNDMHAAVPVAEYNGHIHEDVPQSDSWVYLAQYYSTGEAWNCTETNAIVFYSLNYSYRMTHQAAGRIDRMNTIYLDLYYYYMMSESPIDLAIRSTLKAKKNFNEAKFFKGEQQ